MGKKMKIFILKLIFSTFFCLTYAYYGKTIDDLNSSNPTLKFLDDIKHEREVKRQGQDGQGSNETETDYDYVSFFDDFDNSLLKQDETYYYEEEPALTSSTTSTTTASTIRPSQTTASLDDWQPIFRGSLGQGFGDWIGGVNNRFPVSYADVQPEFLIPVQAENQTRFLQAKSSSQPDENYQKNAERRETDVEPEVSERVQIHPHSIADVLNPITRKIYKNQRSFMASPDPFSLFPTPNLMPRVRAVELIYPQKRFSPDFFNGRWIAQRRAGSGRNRRNAFANTNQGPDNGIRRPDNFYAPDLDDPSPRMDAAEVPFEPRHADGEAGIQGPEDFYSPQRNNPPDYDNGYGPRPGSGSTRPTYNNDGAERPYPNYDAEPPAPEDLPQYPEDPSGPGQDGEQPPAGRGDRQRQEASEEDFFDHDFNTLKQPRGEDLAKPRTFFEDFRGFYTSSNDLEEEDAPRRPGGRGPRPPPVDFGDDDTGFDDAPAPRGRWPPRGPPREDDYDAGEALPPDDDDYGEGPPPPPAPRRPRPGERRPPRDDGGYGEPGGGPLPPDAPEPFYERARPWYSAGPRARSPGRPGGLQYGYFKRRGRRGPPPGVLLG